MLFIFSTPVASVTPVAAHDSCFPALVSNACCSIEDDIKALNIYNNVESFLAWSNQCL